ncbi:hypothetical protein L211DRAFT_844922 [Terfezia boudieri ATCC MYA-4762]|uniref:Uncharacterized protein n=1 Tax=Terfezia boudieri ATCC MYA-4762 TaxID=1051890 RepID=A0A3N4M118_9PEZI|nr:hypothetical protein L211DRAFT_844922 [Terfezia boudieri ATCC MYA-4762]
MSASTPNPATVPLPPSRVGTPLDGGISAISRTQETSSSTPAAGGYEQRHDEDDGSHGRNVLEPRDTRASISSGHYLLEPTKAARLVGIQDSKLSAGVAASIALRAQRPVEVSSPDTRNSAGRAAALAAREVKLVQMHVDEPTSFADSAAVLAHKAAKPAAGTAGTALHPQKNVIYGGEAILASDMLPVIHDAAAKCMSSAIRKATEENLEETASIGLAIQNAAARSASNALPMAVEETLEAGEVASKRRMKISANLEEAARKAAARRLALLDQELYESGVFRRVRLPGYEISQRQSGSLRRTYSMREGVPMGSRRAPAEEGDDYINLLEVAKRNVSRRLARIDLQVADKKGLSYHKDWDDQAMRIAESRIQNTNGFRTTSPGLHGKIDIGGGRLVDAKEVERVALRNVQPVLEEITVKAEAERARVAVERAEVEERKRLENLEKEKNREVKEEKKNVKAAEIAEISRQKSEAKLANGLATREPHTSGTAEQSITHEMPSPPQALRSKLKKLLGKLRKSTTSLLAGAGRGKLTGEERLARERAEREEGEIKTVGLGVDGVPEPVVDIDGASARAPISLSRDATAVEGRPPAVTTETRRDVESGEVFWDRIEYIDPQEYKRRQTEKYASTVGRLEFSTALFRDEPVQRRSLDVIDRTTSSPLPPRRISASLPAQSNYQRPSPLKMPDGGYSISTPVLSNLESKFGAEKLATPTRPIVGHNETGFRPEADVAVSGEETEDKGSGGGRAVPLYDHREHPIDVTIGRTETQKEKYARLAWEREEDVDSWKVPKGKGKNVRIEDPYPEPEQTGGMEAGEGKGGE